MTVHKQEDLSTTFSINKILVSVNAEKNNLKFALLFGKVNMFDKAWQPLYLYEKN